MVILTYFSKGHVFILLCDLDIFVRERTFIEIQPSPDHCVQVGSVFSTKHLLEYFLVRLHNQEPHPILRTHTSVS